MSAFPSTMDSPVSQLLQPPTIRWDSLEEARAAWTSGSTPLRLDGCWGASRALVLASLLGEQRLSCLILVPGQPELRQTVSDLRFFEAFGPCSAEGPRAWIFPPHQPPLWRGGRTPELEAERSALLFRLLNEEPTWIVTTPGGLAAPVPSPKAFTTLTFTLAPGDSIDRDALLEHLVEAGYERVEQVLEVGQWSVRGGIVDIYSPAHPAPFRIELFGDQIESVREFDPVTQRSASGGGQIIVLPMEAEEPSEATLMAYLGPEIPAVLLDPEAIGKRQESGPEPVEVEGLLKGRRRLSLSLLAPEGEADLHIPTRSIPGFRGQMRQMEAQLRGWLAEGFRLRLVASQPEQAHRLREILQEHHLAADVDDALWGDRGLSILTGELSSGFEIPEVGLILLTEAEIFGERRRTLRRPLYKRGGALSSFQDLAPGDLVVHMDYGIGQYLGLTTMAVDGREGDYLQLEYADGEKLYLPVQRLGSISKYLGSDGQVPRLDRLGGTAWQRVKESVRSSLREMAKELLELYASRSVLEGHPFAPDTPWQQEFEAAFRFEETPDQLGAIADVTRNMEGSSPMDRLVCGDVGYGKTEVALRAAFKAVMDGRQVAVLVPTTVLAQQHWQTFRERFAPFPVSVEMLSRFRTPREQARVLKGLKAGTVDVVIGTHRLLSDDVVFKELGLLVIDEEHCFGVAHKEQIKRLRRSVDVLTLTATPIPRTLYMSLVGVRDMSAIATPPAERLAIETVVARFDKRLIQQAIQRELVRGGQVFFVHNRVQSLPSMVNFVKSLVPEARVAMAHGQMRERALEMVMFRFVSGELDVLVSTAIIESGLDIPAANTMVINRADRFGLAQLYQLRGRVGRDRHQAYAYLLVPADGRVDEIAQKRLKVIQELTELGSGFKIAMRDLEIRGAGNLLGAEQHGHIAAVGFDLYCQLLERAVRELKGEEVREEVDPQVSVEAEAYLPESYVGEVSQRLAFYKRLAGAVEEGELAAIREELEDRFGPLPREGRQLFDVAALRVFCRRLGVEKLEVHGGRVRITFAPSTPVRPDRLIALLEETRGTSRLLKEYVLEVAMPREAWPEMHRGLEKLLGRLA